MIVSFCNVRGLVYEIYKSSEEKLENKYRGGSRIATSQSYVQIASVVSCITIWGKNS